jgi:hypothetical protein
MRVWTRGSFSLQNLGYVEFELNIPRQSGLR